MSEQSMIGGHDFIFRMPNDKVPEAVDSLIESLLPIWPNLKVQWENSDDPEDPTNPDFLSCFIYKDESWIDHWETYGAVEENCNTLIQYIGEEDASGIGTVTFVVDDLTTLSPELLSAIMKTQSNPVLN
jgi:hypothetical protein